MGRRGRNGPCDTLGEAVGPATGSQDLAHHVLWPDCSFLRARAFKSRASNLLAGRPCEPTQGDRARLHLEVRWFAAKAGPVFFRRLLLGIPLASLRSVGTPARDHCAH